MPDRHYLDHASSSPPRLEVIAAISAFLEEGVHADPGRPYSEGRSSSHAVERARDALARMLGVDEREVIFTSSGTEAANLANATARAGAAPGAPIVAAPIEHAAVRLAAGRGGPVLELAIETTGRIDLDHLRVLLEASPALVNCQLANHEVATWQPVREVVALCHERDVAVHVDACAAVGQLPIDLLELGADYVSLSAHKFGGPTGVGALVLARGRRVLPQLLGGDQERARRAGMENVIGIVGLGALAEALSAPGALIEVERRSRAQSEQITTLARSVEDVETIGDRAECVPHIVALKFGGIEAEGVVIGLDQAGVAVHSGSSCSSEAFEPSPVLLAMGLEAERSLRVSVGWSTTEGDLAAFGEQFPRVVERLRALAS